MPRLSKATIVAALQALSRKLPAEAVPCELVLLGGAALVLLYDARESTRDVDAVVLQPEEQRASIRRAVGVVAAELGLPEDWLNDGAKAYLQGLSLGEVVFEDERLRVRTAAVEQLLAMKLSAWRDDVDVADAALLLSKLDGTREVQWERVEPFLVPGRELKARYAFDDLLEEIA